MNDNNGKIGLGKTGRKGCRKVSFFATLPSLKNFGFNFLTDLEAYLELSRAGLQLIQSTDSLKINIRQKLFSVFVCIVGESRTLTFQKIVLFASMKVP